MGTYILGGMFRWITILTIAFYGIRFGSSKTSLYVDYLFVLSGHHYWRSIQALSNQNRRYHQNKFWRSVLLMTDLIKVQDFSAAKDLAGDQGEKPESWDLKKRLGLPDGVVPDLSVIAINRNIPGTEIFGKMEADVRYLEGQCHLLDRIVDDPDALPAVLSELKFDLNAA